MRVSLQQASERLTRGEVVGVPTETVYGLAAALSQPAAVAHIFSLKGRPANNPLIIHVSDAEQVIPYVAAVPADFAGLAKAFWPGPLTMILPIKSDSVPTAVRAGLPTAAFRVPGHLLTRQLLAATGPLVMPSANLSGKPSSTCAAHVEEDFGTDFPVLDGGVCLQGLESTILFFTEGQWVIVRQGALAPEAFLPVLGYTPAIAVKQEGAVPLCPGQLYRHYAPKAKLVLSGRPAEHTAVIGFSDRAYPTGCRLFSLGLSTDPNGAGQRLYAVLRQLDDEGIAFAWVDMQFPQTGLWQTLNERLHKAGQK